MEEVNALQWDGTPGHYEVYYLSATDRASGTGLWIRSTMRAPLSGPAECHLWFMAMTADGRRHARKETYPVDQLVCENDPFRLCVADSKLSDAGYRGAMDGIEWDLTWSADDAPAEHVHPLLRKARIAKTILVLPHPDLAVSGTVRFGDTELSLDGVRGGQAHLWGSKHALRWAWVHCNDFVDAESGAPSAGDFVDGVSVVVPRFGREIGPSTPVVGRFDGEDFRSTSPVRVMRNVSNFELTSWRFEAVDGTRRIVCDVDAPRASLVGVTYDDPDGDNVWCYNSEVATMRLALQDKARSGWTTRRTLVADGTAHFEYAQRSVVDGVELLVT